MNKAGGTVSCGTEKRTTARRLVLALVLALLGMLILIMTANAYVALQTEDTLEDFDSGRFIYTGLLDIEPDVQSVQLLPVGLTGEWTTSAYTLPARLVNLAAIANGDIVYVIGGTDHLNHSRSEVYSTKMTGASGEVYPWQTASTLHQARAGAGVAVAPGAGDTSTLYVVGGLDVSEYDISIANTVYRAQIDNHTGQVGTWLTDTQQVPHSLYYASAVAHDGFLYVIGGYDAVVPLQQVYSAAINADGSLNPFVEISPLPEAMYNGLAIVYNGDITDTLYYIGGWNDAAADFSVYFADFLPGGDLTEWQLAPDGKPPRSLYGHSGALVNEREIVVTGGIEDRLSMTFSDTVKAALIDPNNTTLRLYDWCQGEQPPDCTIGAWQTGGLLPEVRALHATVAGNGYLYAIGGEGDDQKPRDTVFFGSVDGAGALYAPEGWYWSDEIDLEQPATLRRLAWEVTIGHPGEMGITMEYRTSPNGETWSAFSDPEPSQGGLNQIEPEEPPTDIRYIQYRASFTTAVTNASPLLDEVHIYYEVPDPDIEVRKNTGTVISAELGSTLQYLIYYTNTGGWVAEDVVLTETLPEHTSYAGSPAWHQIGASSVYTYPVGDVEAGGKGSAAFRVQVDDKVPVGTYYITNRVEADYPPMIDVLQNRIVDPNPNDNWYEFGSPLSYYVLTVTKDSIPQPGSVVAPGSRITYTLYYTNTGTIRATQTVLTDTFDPHETYTIVASSTQPAEGNNIWHLGVLRPREAGEIEIVVELMDPLPNHWLVTNEASLFSPEGDPFHTPVLTHAVMNLVGPEPAPIVDLIVTDVHLVPNHQWAGVWPDFHATVTNQGTANADVPFWVALYIKPQPSEPPQWPADHDRGYCLDGCATVRRRYVEQVPELAEGESRVVLFENLEEDPSPDFPAEGTYDIYVQVDVAFEGDNIYWGVYPEDYEDNNIWHRVLTLGPPTVYLPAVFKSSP